MKAFASIIQFQNHFNTDEKCRAYLEQQRWNGEPCCVSCGSVNVTRLKDGKRFQCNEKKCRKQFSVLVGSVLENTKIPLTKWFLALYILTNHSKGISSLQLASWLGVTQKSAWFLNHRIREILKDANPDLLHGIVEADETVVGGKISNKHVSKREAAKAKGNKSIVFGAVARGGKVITKVVPDTKKDMLINAVKEVADTSAVIVTDESNSYNDLKATYTHVTVNHSKEEYVREAAHTNTIEGYWNILKKQINGIHHFVSPKHLQRYCNESGFRYNNKSAAQDERFAIALSNCEGRLKYSQLIKN